MVGVAAFALTKMQKVSHQEQIVSATTLTRKGQTTIPKAIHAQLGLCAVDRLAFTLLPDGTVLLR